MPHPKDSNPQNLTPPERIYYELSVTRMLNAVARFFVWENLLLRDHSCPTNLLHQFSTSTNHKHTYHNFPAKISPTCSSSVRPLAFLHKTICKNTKKLKC